MRVQGDKGSLKRGRTELTKKGWELLCYLPIKVDALNLKIMTYRMAGKGTKINRTDQLGGHAGTSRDEPLQVTRRNAHELKARTSCTEPILNQTKNKA
jgi:hypothetical protein